MKLHRLDVAGFGPFRDRQTVDFDAFSDDGIFLIAGRTGAGKSSILDAVCFALYGSVPRFAGAKGSLRSDHCADGDRSEVTIDFSTSAGRFRVTRSPEYWRAPRNARSTTPVKEAESAVLERLDGETWVGVAAKPRDVGHEVTGILQLSREQFLQVILLAQNRFAEFLLAKSADRRDLLRQLFGSHRFDTVRERFDERRKASAALLGDARSIVATRLSDAWALAVAHELLPAESAEPALTSERLAVLDDALATARSRQTSCEQQRAVAEEAERAAAAALTSAREIAAAQQTRDAAQQELVTLDAAEAAMSVLRERAERATAAEQLRAVIAAAERAVAEHDAAVTQCELLHAGFVEQAPEEAAAASDDATLQEWIAQRREALGRWEALVLLEQAAPERAAAVAAAEREHAAVETKIAAITAEREELPATLVTLEAAVESATHARDQLPHAIASRDAASKQAEAAATAELLSTQALAAERARVGAQHALADAETHLAALLQRRVDGMAGELAAQLVAGEACAVCGATEHPAPAEHSDPVSADDVAAAEEQRAARSRTEQAAATAATQAQVALAAAQSAAAGVTSHEAEQALSDATQLVTALTERAGTLADVIAERDSARARQATLEDERLALGSTLASLAAAVVTATQAVASADEKIAGERGDYTSIVARRTHLAQQLAAGEALLKALTIQQQQRASVAQRAAERDDALGASGFEELAQVTTALATAAERSDWAAQIEQHARRRHTATETLRSLAERELPAHPVELAPLEESAEQLRSQWQSAIAEETKAAATAAHLAELLSAAHADHARSAAKEQEHQVLENLALTIAGTGPNARKMSLETFVLAAELEEIVDAANRRLRDMSAGRYTLRHSDSRATHGAASGLGIVIDDAFTGQDRAPQSLSGGETFLASLALALGLAEVVTQRAGGVQLDTLFIDEGFGSLDADTLEVAMRTLDELRQGGRTVGVISHVEAMQDAIPAQLRVEATDRGPSVIRS